MSCCVALVAFTACSSSSDSDFTEPTPTQPANGKYTMTVQASKGDGAMTRALGLSNDGTTLNATWAEGEKVYVYPAQEIGDGIYGQGSLSPICELEAANVSGENCTLTGNIDPTGISEGQKLFLQFQGSIGNTGSIGNPQQDGTLQTIANYFDRAYAVVTVSNIGTSTVTTDDATFVNQQAIVKFTLKDKSDQAITLTPTSVAIKVIAGNSASSPITLEGDGLSSTYESDGGFYFAFSQNTADSFSGDITINATTAGGDYIYEKESVTFEPGKYYAITVKMSKLFTCNSSNWSSQVAAFNAETTDNPTLQLTSDIDIFRHNFILTRSNGILDLNGHALSALDVRNNVEGKSITIKNGTVSGSGDVAIDGHPDWADFYKGTVILEDLTVNKMIFVDGHKYIINSGTYNEKIFNVTKSGYPGKLIINGGKFLLSIHGEYSGVTYGTYELRGGKYAIRPEDSWCATGYSVKANTDDDSATYPWIVSEGIQSVPELGDLYYSDGTYSSTLVSGKTPIGVIAYIDQSGTADDEITEKSNGGGHGLVLCLKNAASNLVWHTTREWVFSESVSVQNTAALKRYSDVSGYSLTSTLSASANAKTAFPAAWQAKNYSELTAPSGSTGWFLPSAQQWVRMMTGLGGLSEDVIDYGSVFDNSHRAIDLWDAAFAKAGSGNYDSMSQSSMYWTSSECDETNAIRVVVDQSNAIRYGSSLYINGFVKDGNGSGYCRVRPVLAF